MFHSSGVTFDLFDLGGPAACKFQLQAPVQNMFFGVIFYNIFLPFVLTHKGNFIWDSILCKHTMVIEAPNR